MSTDNTTDALLTLAAQPVLPSPLPTPAFPPLPRDGAIQIMSLMPCCRLKPKISRSSTLESSSPRITESEVKLYEALLTFGIILTGFKP